MGTDTRRSSCRSESSAEWEYENSREFDSSAANIEGRAHNAGVPLVAVLVPDRTQAAMISMMDEWPNGFDPYKLGNELRNIIREPWRNLHRHSSRVPHGTQSRTGLLCDAMDILTPTGTQ